MFLKKEIKSNGITFNVEKTISGVYIQSKCDRYKAYLDIVMLNNKTDCIRLETQKQQRYRMLRIDGKNKRRY